MRLGSFQLPNGASLSYAEYGTSTGNPVLLFHGLVGSICSEGMEESLCGLPVRVIALARPGYGASDYFDMDCVADWGRLLAEFWDHLELWSFDIVGISAGAPYAYNQTDSRWGNKMYGKSGTIGEAGCGPTALAIAVASLTSNQVTPYDVAQWSVENGYRCEGNGSYHSLIPNGGAHYGLTVTGVGNDSKRLVDALKNGKLVIAIMSKGHFTSSGHFIVLRGVTEGGKILVADPASVKRSNQEWELGIILNEASRRAGSGGPFWVMSA